MSKEKIAKYARHFDLAVIQEEGSEIPFAKAAAALFRNVTFITPSQAAKAHGEYHLMIVCLPTPRLISPSLGNVLASIHRLETLVMAPDCNDNDVLRGAMRLRAWGVVPFAADAEEFHSALAGIFPVLVRAYNDAVIHGFQRHITEHSNTLFCICKNGKSAYVNELLKHHFGISRLDEFDRFIADSDLAVMMAQPGSNQKVVEIESVLEGQKAYFVNTHPLKGNETLIAMIPLKAPLQSCEQRIHNRMEFIERLKDAFVVHKKENESIPVIMVHVENSDKIIALNGEHLYHELYKEILARAKSYFGRDAQIAQWHKNVFTVMHERAGLDELKETLERFHHDVSAHVNIEGNVPVLNSFVIDMKGSELDKAIRIIDNIHQKNLLSADIANLVHHEISVGEGVLDDTEEALYYLEKLMLNKTPIKLLNFYKGIRISTPARLVKLSEGLAYLAIEKIQGYAMKLEGHTVIQSPGFPFDLQSDIKIVDVGKKIAVLSQFQPLEASANNRQYIRIQSDHRMHVTLTSPKNVSAGTILDISIKSIACRIGSGKTPPDVGTSVMLQFNLPIARFEGGMVPMAVSGKIQYLQKEDDFTKLVVILDLEEPYESYLSEYIYNRQQALVNEIKTIVNKL